MDYFESSIHEAILAGDVSSVEDFLTKGLSPDHVFRSTKTEPSAAARLGKTLLEEAVGAGQVEVVRLLARHGCDPNLTYVVDVDSQLSLKFRPYVKKDRLKLTCLYSCLVKQQIQMLKELLAAGMDVDIYDDRGCTALWHAVDLQDYEMASAMVVNSSSPRGGCDVNAADVTMLRPLHVAALHGNVRLVSLLLRYGAVVDAVQIRGSTPLILACRAPCVQTARLLLLNGADPNHVGLNGHVALSAALESSADRALPDLLIQAGANVDCSTVSKCRTENLPLLQRCPEMLDVITEMARAPRALKLLSMLTVRKVLLSGQRHDGRASASGSASRAPISRGAHFVHKVQCLPVPQIIQEYILLSYLK